MKLYKITFKGTAYVRADSEIGAEDKFSEEEYHLLNIHVDKVEQVEGVDEDGE